MARLAAVRPWGLSVGDSELRGDFIDRAQIEGTKGDDHLHGRRAPDTIDGLGGNDVLNGRYGDDMVDGGKGDDVLKGSTGADILSGGAGADRLYGGTEEQEAGAGRDHLDGGSGDDRLYGGFETDVLTGGDGRDRFTYLSFSDSTVDTPDIVIDFEQGVDKLVFRDDFREGDALHFIGNSEFSQIPGEVRFLADSDQSVILIDVDGNGMADTRIYFGTGIQFQVSDFSF